MFQFKKIDANLRISSEDTYINITDWQVKAALMLGNKHHCTMVYLFGINIVGTLKMS